MSETYYIDTSHHDYDRAGRALHWPEIRRATSNVMMAKLSEGDPAGYWFVDPRGGQALRDAKAAGFAARGGYHIPVRGDQASTIRQVDAFRRLLDAGRATWAMLDAEPLPELVSRGLVPRWTDLARFAARWEFVKDHRPLVGYIAHSFWESSYLGSPNLNDWPWPIVSANYPAGNPAVGPVMLYTAGGGAHHPAFTAYGHRTPDIGQIGSRCKVPGASAGSDINCFRGTEQALISLVNGTPAGVPASPTPGGSVHMLRFTFPGYDKHVFVTNGTEYRRVPLSSAINDAMTAAGAPPVHQVSKTVVAGWTMEQTITALCGVPVGDAVDPIVLAAAIVAALPRSGTPGGDALSADDVEAAVRRVFSDAATPDA
jgi:hypothetical protein